MPNRDKSRIEDNGGIDAKGTKQDCTGYRFDEGNTNEC